MASYDGYLLGWAALVACLLSPLLAISPSVCVCMFYEIQFEPSASRSRIVRENQACSYVPS